MNKQLVLLLALLALPASGQAIQQSGSATPGHALQFVTNGVAKDAGSAAAGNLTELGVTKAGGNAICVNSGPVSAAYQALCLGASTTGGGTINLQKYGTAPAAPLTFTVNGVQVLSLSGATGGFATITGSPVTGNCAKFTSATSLGDYGGPCGGNAAIAANTLLGNNTGSSAVPAALTRLQTLNLLGLATNAVSEGADRTGAVDSTAALNAALATCVAYIPAGTYKTTAALTTGMCTNITIIGDGSAVTTITLASTTAEGFINTATNGNIGGFTVTRTGTPTSAGTGLDFQASTNQMRIFDVVSTGHYNGIILGSNAWGEAYNVVSESNYSTGFLLQNNVGRPDLQWNMLKTLAQFNNGVGYYVNAQGTVPVTVNPWINIQSFGNTGGGAFFIGNNTGGSLEGIFLADSELDQDGEDELRFITYGTKTIMVQNTIAALAGQGTTGRNLGTAASNLGSGVATYTSNRNLVLTGVYADGNSQHGVSLGAQDFFDLQGVTATNNSMATPGMYDGVAAAGSPTGTINGGLFANLDGNTTQRYGLDFANASNITVTGGAALGNATGPVNVSSGALTCFGLQGYSSCGGGGGSVSITAASGIATSPSTITGTGTVGLAAVAGGGILANDTGGSAVPTAHNLTSILDFNFGNPAPQGSILYRNGSVWITLGPGTTGQLLETQGAGANPQWITASGTGTVTSVAGNNGLTGTVTTAGNIGLAPVSAGGILANDTGSTAVPTAQSMNSLLDFAFGAPAPQGSILYKGPSAWGSLVSTAFPFGAVLTGAGSGSNPTFSTEFHPMDTSVVGVDLSDLTGSPTTTSTAITLDFGQAIGWKKNGGGAYAAISFDSSGTMGLGTNATLIVPGATMLPGTDNTYALGGLSNRWTTVYATTGTINTSDERAKHDIRPSDLGLDFIDKVKAVSFEYNGAANDNHRHYGVTVQQLESVLGAKDFGAIHKPAKPEDMAGLNYEELIAPLIKSVQELSAENAKLKFAARKDNEALKLVLSRLDHLEAARTAAQVVTYRKAASGR